MAQQNTIGFTVEVVPASVMIDSSVVVWPYGYEPGVADEQPAEPISETRAVIPDQEVSAQPTLAEAPIVTAAVDEQPTELTSEVVVEFVVASTTSVDRGGVARSRKESWKDWDSSRDRKYQEAKAEVKAWAEAGDISSLERRERELFERQNSCRSRKTVVSNEEWARMYALIGDIRALMASAKKRRDELDADQAERLRVMADEAVISGNLQNMEMVLGLLKKEPSSGTHHVLQDSSALIERVLREEAVGMPAMLRGMIDRTISEVTVAMVSKYYGRALYSLARMREEYEQYLFLQWRKERFVQLRKRPFELLDAIEELRKGRSEHGAQFDVLSTIKQFCSAIIDPFEVFEVLQQWINEIRMPEVVHKKSLLEAAIQTGNTSAVERHAADLQRLGEFVDRQQCMERTRAIRATMRNESSERGQRRKKTAA